MVLRFEGHTSKDSPHIDPVLQLSPNEKYLFRTCLFSHKRQSYDLISKLLPQVSSLGHLILLVSIYSISSISSISHSTCSNRSSSTGPNPAAAAAEAGAATAAVAAVEEETAATVETGALRLLFYFLLEYFKL